MTWGFSGQVDRTAHSGAREGNRSRAYSDGRERAGALGGGDRSPPHPKKQLHGREGRCPPFVTQSPHSDRNAPREGGWVRNGVWRNGGEEQGRIEPDCSKGRNGA